MNIDFSPPKAVLPFLKDKVDDFYLAGGTALSMFYFEHRESFDLDFFTRNFSKERILKIVDNLEKDSQWKVELVSEQRKENLVGVAIYMIHLDQEKKCKLDFVEDYIESLNPLKRVNGLNVLSLEDIYLRKIYAITGHVPTLSDIGRKF